MTRRTNSRAAAVKRPVGRGDRPGGASRRSMWSRRAQSTTLGFVFVFSLITLTIGSVYVVGFAGIQDAQSAERINNMERAFEVLDDNMEDVIQNEAPSRATEIKLSGGRLAVDTRTQIRVNVTNQTGADPPTVNGSRSVVYSDEGTSIAATSTAVVRGEDSGSVMLAEPNWITTSERVVIPLLAVNQIGNGSIGGDGTVLVVTNAVSRSVVINERTAATDLNVTVTVESPRIEAWDRYLRAQGLTRTGGPPADDDGDGVPEVTYYIETRQVQIPKIALAIDFDQ